MADQASSSSSSDDEEDYLQQRAGMSAALLRSSTSNPDPSGSPNIIGNAHEIEGESALINTVTSGPTSQLTVMKLRNRKKAQQQDLQTGFDGFNLDNGGM